MRETGVFGQRLAQLRQEAGLSQQALADRLAVTRQAVSNWEREQTLPDLDMLRALARALGTDLNTLCGAAPAAPRRPWKRAAALALLLSGAAFCGGYWLRGGVTGSAADAAPAAALGEHRVEYTVPAGITVRRAADGWQELTALLAEAPAGETDAAIRSRVAGTACYFAAQYALADAPAYRNGRFSSWDQTVYWLYKAGISGGGVLTEARVDEAIAALFGPDARYAHSSAARLPLTAEGYLPLDVASAAEEGRWTVTALARRADGWTLALRREHGTAVSLTLAEGDGQLFLRAIERGAGD